MARAFEFKSSISRLIAKDLIRYKKDQTLKVRD